MVAKARAIDAPARTRPVRGERTRFQDPETIPSTACASSEAAAQKPRNLRQLAMADKFDAARASQAADAQAKGSSLPVFLCPVYALRSGIIMITDAVRQGSRPSSVVSYWTLCLCFCCFVFVCSWPACSAARMK